MSVKQRLARWGASGLLAAALALVALVPTAGPAANAETVKLDFVVWSYSVDTIQDNIKKFEKLNPGITVSLADNSWFTYHDFIATKFAGGSPPDVAYSSDHWLQEWAAAGWLQPLDKYLPQLSRYKKEWAPYARQGMTYQGHLYGVPYYADNVIFIYNKQLLQKAGFKSAPKTWGEVAKIAQSLKQKGLVTYPVNIPLKKDDPWLIEIFYSMVYGNGGHMFDAKANPLFNAKGGAAERSLQWLQDAMQKWKIFNPASPENAEPDVVKTMGAGQSAFTILAKYNLAELNLGQHTEKGNFRQGLMPGSAHSTVGFVRFYALTKRAVDRGPDVINAAGKFLNYFGGKTNGQYKVEKRWALEKGLGFANLPLYNDKQIRNAINKWGNVDLERKQATLARAKEGLTPWWGTWDIYAREQLTKAVLGQQSPREALDSMAKRWGELRKQYKP